MKYTRSGQYELIKLTITTKTSNPVVLDIEPSFTDAAIYESIFDHTMSGNVSFVDTNNIVQKYGLGHGETVEIEWTTAGVGNSTILVSGEVYDLAGPNQIGDHSSGYTLHFASPESLASIKKRMFSGYTTSCSEIIRQIFERIRRMSPIKTKALIADETRNIENIVFTGQPAISAIQLVVDRAVAASGDHGMLFYENNQEFRLTSLEQLYKQDPVIEYTYKSQPAFEDVKNAQEESFNTFQDFEVDVANKHADDVLDGQYGSAWGYLSLFDKNLSVVNYDSKARYDQAKSLGKNPNILDSNFNSDYSDRLTIMYSMHHEPNEEAVVLNKMKLLKASTININIGVFGASLIKVGDVCLASIPSFSSDDFSDKSFDAMSGKFLISEIKHLLTPKTYNQRVQLLKDSFEEVIA